MRKEAVALERKKEEHLRALAEILEREKPAYLQAEGEGQQEEDNEDGYADDADDTDNADDAEDDMEAIERAHALELEARELGQPPHGLSALSNFSDSCLMPTTMHL